MAVDVEYYVTGLRELRSALRKVDPALGPVLTRRLKVAGERVVQDARANVRRDVSSRSKGRAAASIRTTSSGGKVFINGGKRSLPYYGWLDFGGVLQPKGRRKNRQHRPVLKKGRYIYPAIDANQLRILAAVTDAVDDTMRDAGFR